MNSLESLVKIVEASGGQVKDNLFVVRPGVKCISATTCLIDSQLASLFGLPEDPAQQIAALGAKVTYMDLKPKSDQYLPKIVNEFGHTSILNSIHVGYLLAGIKGETLLEFASTNANMSRQTTSRTRSAVDTLYVAPAQDEDFYKQFIELRKLYLQGKESELASKNKDSLEQVNGFNLFTKAMFCTVSNSLQNWIYFINSRLTQDYEYELVDIAKRIRDDLASRYPFIQFSGPA